MIVLTIIRAGFRKNRAGKPRRENQAGKTGPVSGKTAPGKSGRKTGPVSGKTAPGEPRREKHAGKTRPVWCGNQGDQHTLPIH